MGNDPKPGKGRSLLRSWKTDYRFKTLVSAALSFAVTVVFASYNGYLGVRLLSIWHGGICLFYLLLAVIRGTILLTEMKNARREDSEKEKYRRRTFIVSSALLLLLNLSLIVPISLMVVMKRPVNMTLIPAIAMAVYTTYKITMVSIHLRRQRRRDHRNILVTQLRVINLIDALVSILALQNTLIMVNRTDPYGGDMLTLSAVSSAAIYLVIVLITVGSTVMGLKKKD